MLHINGASVLCLEWSELGFSGCLLHYTRPIQSNKTEQKTNRTQSNSNRSIGLGNRTKSNTYFAVSSIFEPIEPI